MFDRLGRFTTSRPWAICAAWLLAGVVLTAVAPDWDTKTQDDDIRFLPERCPSVRGYHLLEKAFPQDIFASRAIFAVERDNGPLTNADFALVDRFIEALKTLKEEEPSLQIGGGGERGFLHLSHTDYRRRLGAAIGR